MLRTLTYRASGLDDGVIPHPTRLFHLKKHREGLALIGDLDILPLELFFEVLALLDLQSVVSLRTVNTKSMWIVDSFHQYSTLATHAPGVLYALVSTGVASNITVHDLYDIFCTPACAECGKFGAFFYLPECKRCCMRCLTFSRNFMPMSVPDAERRFGLTAGALAARMPVVHTVPGVYTRDEEDFYTPEVKNQEARMRLVSRSRVEDYMDSVSNGTNFHRPKFFCGNAVRMYMASGHIYRFMCAAPFPHFNCSTQTINRGVSCKGCKLAEKQGSSSDLAKRSSGVLQNGRLDEMYSEDVFLEHFNACHNAQAIWESGGNSECN